MTQGLASWLVPYANWLLSYAAKQGWNPRVTSTYRSWETQRRLYVSYIAGQSQYPAAPPGESYHNYGRAFDVVTQPMDRLHQMGALWKQMGGRWWKSDPIHFEA